MGHHVATALIVVPLETFARDGDILAATVARSRGLRKINAQAWPQFVFGAIDHAHNLRLQVLIAVQRQRRSKLAIGAYRREVIFTPDVRQGSLLDQAHEFTLLHRISMVNVAHMLLQAPQETATEQWREVYHTSAKLQINPETQEITGPKIGKRDPFVYETRASLLRSDAIAFPAVSMAWNMQIHG